MSEGEVQGASRPARRLILSALAIWAVLVFGVPLTSLTSNIVRVAGFPLGFSITAMGALAALTVLALVFAVRAGGDRQQQSLQPALRFAGETLGSAGFIGFAGAIAALGFDGLAYPLGVVAGLALMAILIAPRFVLYPVTSMTGFFAARYGGVWPRRTAFAITVLSAVLLLAADVRGGALAIQGLAVTDYATGLAIASVVLTAVWFAGGLITTRAPVPIVYGVLLVCFLVTLVLLTLYQGRFPLPHLVYGQALSDLADIEQKLIQNKLSDVKSLRPMVAPFLHLSVLNFAGLVFGLALGVAALPHLAGRHISRAVVAAGDAAHRTAVTVGFAGLFLAGLAAYAVFARLGVASVLATGLETAALPPNFLAANGLGWVEICGSHSTVAADVAAACAKSSGQRGFLRLQDLAFTNDGYAFAAPWLSGLPAFATLSLWAGALVASLAAGQAILAGLVVARGPAYGTRAQGAIQFDVRSAVLAAGVVLAALAVAVLGSLEIPELASEGLALVASGLFPALVLGLYWRHMNSAGATAAMIAGFGIAALYIGGIRLFPVQFFDVTGAVSNAAPVAVRKFADLKAAIGSAVSDDARTAASVALVRHASLIANWWGLKPGAAAVLGVPVGVAAGVVAALISQRGRPAATA